MLPPSLDPSFLPPTPELSRTVGVWATAGSLTGATLTEPHSPRYNYGRQRSSRQNHYPTSHSHPLVPSQFLPLSKPPRNRRGEWGRNAASRGQGQDRRAGGRCQHTGNQSPLPSNGWARVAVPTPAAPALPVPPTPRRPCFPCPPPSARGWQVSGCVVSSASSGTIAVPVALCFPQLLRCFRRHQPNKLPARSLHTTPPTPTLCGDAGWAERGFSKPQVKFQPCLGLHAGSRWAAP